RRRGHGDGDAWRTGGILLQPEPRRQRRHHLPADRGHGTGSVAPVPLPAGDQSLQWDPLAAGLPPGTYDVALVADDGVSRVVSPSFQVTVATAPPTPTPTTSPAAAPRSRAGRTGVPPWV